ncbi:MAG: major capsid protein [Microviridae sp.]|nr:MAG: major capsid protein [Microviridae sp.]
MSLTKSIGKNTLGGGKKMEVDLKTYNRSTHDLSFAWRNTQSVGTLVPFMCEVGLPADTWDIELNSEVLTHPTVGPLFGSFKWQLDVFTCPIRLYNSKLHNNALNIGLDMSKVKLPKFEVTIGKKYNDTTQINPSCLLAYLGRRGYGYTDQESAKMKFNATPIIAYYDIFKNYYANKQEENFKVIASKILNFRQSYTDSQFVRVNETYELQNEEFNDGFDGLDNNNIRSGQINIYYNITWNVGGGTETISNSINTTIGDINDGVAIDNNIHLQGTIEYLGSETMQTNLTVTSTKLNGTIKTFNAFIIECKNSTIITLKDYPLTSIDNVRDAILGNKTEYIANDAVSGEDYLKNITEVYTRQDNENVIHYEYNSGNALCGLALKTYQSDIFNNWINTEWIDGENGINAITAIDTTAGNFTLDTLNLSKKVYDMLNRIAVSGGTYQDWIETVYTNNYLQREETPVYQGGLSDEIVFQEVISNSAAEDEPLGSLAGRGKLQGKKKGGSLHIKINEPCYIIGICSITPRVDYCQGNRYDTDFDTLNDLHKPALDGIGFQDLNTDKMHWKGYKIDATGKITRQSVGKQPAWLDYMTNYNKTFGNFAIEDNEAFMCLNRLYTEKNGNINVSTYIEPTKYNYIFADTSLDAMNFWAQIGVGATVRRMISAKTIPNL